MGLGLLFYILLGFRHSIQQPIKPSTINLKPHTLTEAEVPKSALADGEVASDSAVETGLTDLFSLTMFKGNFTF